jgi:hypothetical protein
VKKSLIVVLGAFGALLITMSAFVIFVSTLL